MTGGHPDPDPARSEDEVADLTADLRAELAQAETEEADARAEAARARAASTDADGDRAADADADVDPVESTDARRAAVGPAAGPGRRWIVRTVALGIAALLSGAVLTLTALMLWQHGKLSAQRGQDRRFVDAARDGVVALLTIDHTRARADVQRVLDLSSGQFHDDFAHNVDDFVKTAEDSQAVTKGTVNVAALDDVDGNRARVLIAAISEVTNVNGAKQDARPFRMSVTVTCDGETCKMSDVEFVP